MLVVRIHSINLQHFNFPPIQDFWFPVSASVETFPNGGYNKDTPQHQEYYQIVNGTLMINQNLQDSRFSVSWHSNKHETGEFALLFQKKSVSEPQSIVPLRNSPSQLENDLLLRLKEADEQAARLSALPSNQYQYYGVTFLQVVFSSIGVVALAVSFIMMRRFRQ